MGKMKYLNKFSKFFKRQKDKIPFERILINLQKFIDSVCPDEVDCKKIGSTQTAQMNRQNGHILIDRIKINNVTLIDNKHPENLTPKSLGCGRIKITLSQDDKNYIVITMLYNNDMKFDMSYWLEQLCINNVYQGCNDPGSDRSQESIYMPQISHGLEGSLFDKIAKYLEENDLRGTVDI